MGICQLNILDPIGAVYMNEINTNGVFEGGAFWCCYKHKSLILLHFDIQIVNVTNKGLNIINSRYV
jgi:hypothetical protein